MERKDADPLRSAVHKCLRPHCRSWAVNVKHTAASGLLIQFENSEVQKTWTGYCEVGIHRELALSSGYWSACIGGMILISAAYGANNTASSPAKRGACPQITIDPDLGYHRMNCAPEILSDSNHSSIQFPRFASLWFDSPASVCIKQTAHRTPQRVFSERPDTMPPFLYQISL